MRFCLLDRIVSLESGERITAVIQLRADEEYLRDHFPKFPVMPGVLMLEALFQASMWLVRASEDFRHSVVLLREARNVKYADFVAPGQELKVTSSIVKLTDESATLKGQGTVNGTTAVSGRLTLGLSNLADENPLHQPIDFYTRRRMQEEFDRLRKPAPSVA